MKAYINGIGNISPQKTFHPKDFLTEIISLPGNRLTCIDPNYADYIDPRLLRRMSRLIRMGWTTAKICLSDAGIEIPDSIITGTGMGCIEDTEKFLLAIYENDERFLPPTPFIQSTHNTVGAQVALMLQCTNYNLTYTQRGIAFENALSDALSLMKEPEYRNVLVGGFDEMTDNQLILYNRLNYYKSSVVSNLKLLSHKDAGTIAGEGTAFFLLGSEKGLNNYAVINDVNTFNYPPDNEFVLKRIKMFLDENGLAASDIDLLIAGYNGDFEFDKIYTEAIQHIFPETPVGYFKHLCGEYHTASTFAVWLSANILRQQAIPEIIRLNKIENSALRNILIYNNYRLTNHSLILLSAC